MSTFLNAALFKVTLFGKKLNNTSKISNSMQLQYNLNRFLEAQESKYSDALKEIQNGSKQTHWMWFVFPQIKGLGFTDYNIFYGIENLAEAQEYYDHPILGQRLIEITKALLGIENKTALEILGKSDERKLKSCMTLFSLLPNTSNCFELVLKKFCDNQKDDRTIKITTELNE